MDFFKELMLMCDGELDLTIKFKRVGDKLKVSVLPENAPNLLPLELTGSSQELEDDFFNLIRAPMVTARLTIQNAASFTKQLEKLATDKQAALDSEKNKPKPAAAAASKTKQPNKAKPVKNADTEEAEETDDDDDKEEKVKPAAEPKSKISPKAPEKKAKLPKEVKPEGPAQLTIC